MFEPTDERYVPWSDDFTTGYEHMHRYAFAKRFAKGKKVLDLASGEGYGSFHLADVAESVTGIDIDHAIIAHASSVYKKQNLNYMQGSIFNIPKNENHEFDLVTCFEALEHIVEHDELMHEVKRMLKSDGIFLVSTPNKPVYSNQGMSQNPFHLKELEFDEFESLLRQHFKHVQCFGQKTYASSRIFPLDKDQCHVNEHLVEGEGHDARFTEKPDEYPRYFIALCSDVNLPLSDDTSYLIDISDKPGFVAWQLPLKDKVNQSDPWLQLSTWGLFKKLIKKSLLVIQCRWRAARDYLYIVSDIVLALCRSSYQRLRHGSVSVLPVMSETAPMGGTELQFFLISKALIENGLSAFSLTFGEFCRGHESFISKQMKSQNLLRINLYQRISAYPALKKLHVLGFTCLLKIIKPRIVLLFNPASLSLVHYVKKQGNQVVYFEAALPDAMDKSFKNLVAHLAALDHVITVSNASFQRLIKQFHYKHKGSVIPALTEILDEDECSSVEIKQTFHILFVGRLYPQKGLDTLINAFYWLYKAHPNVRLTIVGEGPYKANVEKNIRYRKLDHVVNLTGVVPKARLIEAMKSAAVFCLPSLSEGTPCSIIEAMSFRLPVVATAVGGIPEIVDEGITGLLVAPRNAKELFRALERLYLDDVLRQSMSMKAFEKYQRDLHPNKLAQQHVSTLRLLMNEYSLD